MTTYHGKCHCGQTEWTTKLDADAHILCHCNACKLLSGGESTLNQMANEGDLKITKGSTKTYTYHGDSGKPVNCHYCPNCTSHIYHHQTVLGPKIVVRTGLLQGAAAAKFPVAAEIFGKDRLSWQPEIAKTFVAGPE
ncbi:hypothetical protein IMSHALPRED_004958 [Imshaugia aleurites]|uniref:CENP-V/GFA domain-containing protein n=1 Tax=Imshaugia aleurites TaxID=172621 RepID=A0A8H3F718_9LECA|nr:hypothetical protein IMSHALPRED_004958 [Imshaugia aleurites]